MAGNECACVQIDQLLRHRRISASISSSRYLSRFADTSPGKSSRNTKPSANRGSRALFPFCAASRFSTESRINSPSEIPSLRAWRTARVFNFEGNMIVVRLMAELHRHNTPAITHRQEKSLAESPKTLLPILIRPIFRHHIARLQIKIDVLSRIRPEPLHLVRRHLPPLDIRIIHIRNFQLIPRRRLQQNIPPIPAPAQSPRLLPDRCNSNSSAQTRSHSPAAE